MHVTGLDHNVLRVADVEVALAWYRDVLGLGAEHLDEWRAGEAPFPSVRVDDATIIDLVTGPPSGTNLDQLRLVVELRHYGVA